MPSSGQESIPFWRDGRVIGVLAQIAFVIGFILVAGWFVSNIRENLGTLGRSQFICEDGTFSYRCAFDFMRADAQFDIAETPINYDPADSYWRALGVGALNTVKVTALGIVLTTILGTVVGIARLSPNWFIRNLAKWYVDLLRNTPLVLQLVFIYFSFLLALPQFTEAINPAGIPLFISRRGINMAWPVFMPSFATWMAFVILAIIQVQVLWVILGRQEEITGKEQNRLTWAIVSFIAVIGIGWFVASNESNQAVLTPAAARIREFDDFEQLVLNRLNVNQLSDIEGALAAGRITQEDVDAAALKICVLRDAASEANFTAQLRGADIPYLVTRTSRQDQATSAYAEGECEAYLGPTAIIAGERDVLENASAHNLLPVHETPVRVSIPRIEGFNFVGGAKMTTEFTAILIGLVLNTGANVAEIVRAGIQSVSKGQTEAARALGLSESQRLRLVVLPQALKVIIPPQTSQYLNLAKNSSLALVVAYPDFWNLGNTTINQSGRAIQIMLLVMGTYLMLSLAISALLNWYNNRISLVER
ncbi:MAG: ABC transporter permease subunit [Anaerolineales bacterium]|nr:ABC transporter permease subunit [Anaerolineales bacterium]